MNTIIFAILAKIINADVIGGWVRAAVIFVSVALTAKFPIFSSVLTPETQATIAGAIAAFIVGIWQQAAKSMTAPTVTQTVAVMQVAADKGVVPQATATAVKTNPDIAMAA